MAQFHTFFVFFKETSFDGRERELQTQILKESQILEKKGQQILGNQINTRSNTKASVTIFYR